LSNQEKGYLQQFRPFQYSSPVVQSTDSRQLCRYYSNNNCITFYIAL